MQPIVHVVAWMAAILWPGLYGVLLVSTAAATPVGGALLFAFIENTYTCEITVSDSCHLF